MGGVRKCEWPNAPANAGIQPRRTSSVTECANSLYPAWINECRSMFHVHPGARLASFVHIGWRRRSELDSTHWCDVFDNRQLVVCLCWSDSVKSWWSKMNAVNALQWNCCHFSRVFAKHLEMAHWSENYWGKSYKLCLDLDGSDNEDLRPGNVLSYLQLGRQSAGPQWRGLWSQFGFLGKMSYWNLLDGVSGSTSLASLPLTPSMCCQQVTKSSPQPASKADAKPKCGHWKNKW